MTLARGAWQIWGNRNIVSAQRDNGAGPHGETAGLTATIQALKQTIAELTANERMASTMLETIPAVVLRISADERIEYINRILPEYSGSPLVGETIYAFAPPDQHELMRESLLSVRKTRSPSSFESLAEAPDGTRDWYHTTVGPILEGGTLRGFTLISTNVSRTRRVEQELSESQARLRFALDAGNIGAWRWDILHDRVQWEDKLCSLFGVPPAQAPRTRDEFLALVPVDQRSRMRAHIESAVRTGVYPDFELRLDEAERTRWFIIKGGPVRGPDGSVVSLMGGVIDNTERKEIEEHLRHAQKLELAGLLSAGISHNFNNMLAVIVPVLEMARRNPSDLAPGLLGNALESAMQAGRLVKQLQVFANDRTARGLPESLGYVVGRVFELCRRTFDRRITIECAGTSLAQDIYVDGALMEQALMNIMINARDSLSDHPNGGARIQVELRRVEAASPAQRIPGATGDFVLVEIRDTGRGMDEQTSARIFEPFFTTKAGGRGTGLGLSTAWMTLQAHRGTIECESTPGSGTTFRLLVPKETGVEPPPNEDTTGGFGGRGEAILVVDDEPAVRHATSEMLRALGYTAFPAASGEEAMAIAGKEDIAAALLDHSMPGMSPESTLTALRELLPGLPIISFSGLGGSLPGASTHLVKPVTSQTLALCLRALLEPDPRSTP